MLGCDGMLIKRGLTKVRKKSKMLESEGCGTGFLRLSVCADHHKERVRCDWRGEIVNFLYW